MTALLVAKFIIAGIILVCTALVTFGNMPFPELFKSPWMNMMYLFVCYMLIAWEPIIGTFAMVLLCVIIINVNISILSRISPQEPSSKPAAAMTTTTTTTTSEESHETRVTDEDTDNNSPQPQHDCQARDEQLSIQDWKKYEIKSNVQTMNGWGSYEVRYDVFAHV